MPSLARRVLVPLLLWCVSTPWAAYGNQKLTKQLIADINLFLTEFNFDEKSPAPEKNPVNFLIERFRKDPKYTDYLKKYALIYHSQSAEAKHSDEKFPRIVFGFSPGSNFLFSAPGRPDGVHKGSYRELEAIVFEPEDGEYVFVRIAFPCHDATSPAVDVTVNPDRCFKCHSVRVQSANQTAELPLNYPHHGRPLWGAYGLWPGAFGGAGTYSPSEEQSFKTLCRNAAKKDDKKWMRYSFFLSSPSNEKQCWDEYKSASPNASLTSAISHTNWNRIATHLVRSQPFFEKYRFALLGAALHCRELEKFLPDSLRAAHQKDLGGHSLADLLQDTEKQALLDWLRRKSELQTIGAAVDPTAATPELPVLAPRFAGLRYIVDGQALDPNLVSTYWSTSAPPGGYSRSVASGTMGTEREGLAYFYRLILPFVEKDTHVGSFGLSRLDPLSEKEPPVCEKLADLSRKGLR